MFTGIVTDLGRVIAAERTGDARFRIACRFDLETLALGASVACSGVCLTVVDKGIDGGQAWFAVDVSQETLARTTLGDWLEGTEVNLERSLRLGDELGGHIVSGHVDGVGEVVSRRPDGESQRFVIAAPRELMRFVAPKGSIAVDGTSLTVNEVEDDRFGVNIIPHTLQVTTWGGAQPGRRVNVEIDMLARYVARLLEAGQDLPAVLPGRGA